jgi:L-ascorbate metabolism protein UlaG (beta-lactamase superfamily)
LGGSGQKKRSLLWRSHFRKDAGNLAMLFISIFIFYANLHVSPNLIDLFWFKRVGVTYLKCIVFVLRKILLRIFLTVVLSVVIIIIGIMAFINLSPQFGAAPEGDHLEKIKQSKNYSSGQFQNLIPTNMDLNLRSGSSVMYEWLFQGNDRSPAKPLPTAFEQAAADSALQVTWFGHSAILLEIDGKKLLLDPMLGEAAAPVSFMTRRFDYQQAIDLDSIPTVDAAIISHDHYDHLDYQSIKALKDRVGHFYTALGVGAHLQRWGVDASKITEMDWWENAMHDGLEFVAAPARHFSGRGIADRNKTQWASWIIIGRSEKVYFSGDSGYGPHFKEIGEKYGPFDFAMMECGQYNERWEAIHMMPEQTVQAGLDVEAKKLMPIHWGAFNLSLHSWTDPVERALKAAENRDVEVLTPVIGKKFALSEASQNQESWWKSY